MASDDLPDFLSGFSSDDFDLDLGIQFVDEKPDDGASQATTEAVEAISTKVAGIDTLEDKVNALQSTLSGIKNLLDFDDINIEGKLDRIIEKLDEGVETTTASELSPISEEKLDKIMTAIGDPEKRKAEVERRLQEAIDKHKEKLNDKLSDIEKMTLPLLVNLIKPESLEQKYIYWPNRKEIIERQIKRILSITREKDEE